MTSADGVPALLDELRDAGLDPEEVLEAIEYLKSVF